MRALLVLTILFIGCESNNKLNIYGEKEDEILNFENSIPIKNFLVKVDSLSCQDFKVFGNLSNIEFKILNRCKFSKMVKFISLDGITMPIYQCNGFRIYGINLCEKNQLNLSKFKEFYLNPKKREDYPKSPKNAIFKIVVDEGETIQSIKNSLKFIDSMREKIQNENLSNLPIAIIIETIQRDSNLTKAPKQLN